MKKIWKVTKKVLQFVFTNENFRRFIASMLNKGNEDAAGK